MGKVNKSSRGIMYGFWLTLILFALCPIYVFAQERSPGSDDPQRSTRKRELGSSQGGSTAKQSSEQSSRQEAALVSNLFKESTYEDFASQEKVEKKIFDESHLEPGK